MILTLWFPLKHTSGWLCGTALGPESYKAAKPQVSAITESFLPGGHVCIIYLQGI